MSVMFTNPNVQYFDSNGDPLAGGKLYFYEAGTSTPLDTYSDDDLLVANANPVVLGSDGRAGSIRLANADYKVVLKTSADVTIWTVDDVHGGPANPLFSAIRVVSGNTTLDSSDNGKLIAVTATATITLPAATIGTSYRVGIVNAGAGIVTVARAGSDTFETAQTAVRLAPAQGCFFQPDGTSKWYTVGKDGRGKGADIASASSLNLGQDGHYFHVTGTTGITAIEARPRGWEIVLTFDDAVEITHNASTLIMPGAANFTTATGDTLTFTAEDDSGAWRCTAVALAGSIGFDISALSQETTPADTAMVAISIGSGSGNNRKAAIAEVGGLCFLEEQTASASATIDFDLTAYPEFKHFLLVLDDIVPGTDNVELHLLIFDDGGTTPDTGASDYAYKVFGYTTALVANLDDAHTAIELQIANLGTGSNEQFSARIWIYDPAASGKNTRFEWTGCQLNQAAQQTTFVGSGARLTDQTTTDIRIMTSSGNIASGTLSLYGIRG